MKSTQINILVLDSDGSLHRFLTGLLPSQTIQLVHQTAIQDVKTLLDTIRQQDYSVIMLDEKLHNGFAGLQVAREIQREFTEIEIMMFGTNKPEVRAGDMYRYFQMPLDDEVVALNVLLASRKNQMARKRRRALEALQNASTRLIEIHDKDELLSSIVSLASSILDTYRSPGHFSHLAIYDKQNNELVFGQHHHEVDVWTLITKSLGGNSVSLSETAGHKIGIIGRAHRNQKIINQGNVSHDQDYLHLHSDVNSQLSIPIVVLSEPYGILSVEHHEANAFDDDDVYTLKTLATLAQIAIQRAELIERERKQSTALRILHKITRVLADETLQAEAQIIRESVRQAKNLMDVKGEGYLSHMAIKEGRWLIFAEAHNPENVFQLIEKKIGGVIDLDNPPNGRRGIIGRAVEEETTQCVGNVLEDPDYIEFNPSVRSQLAVPIFVEGKVKGAINIEHPNFDAFDASDVSNLEILASSLANTLRYSALIDIRDERAEKLASIYDAGEQITRSTDRDDVLANIALAALKIVGMPVGASSSFCHISLVKDNKLVIEYTSPPLVRTLYQDRLRKEINLANELEQLGISGLALKLARVINEPDVAASPQYIEMSPEVRSQISIPMIFDDIPIGVISIESAEIDAFKESDEQYLSLLGRLGAIALRNVQLDAETTQQRQVTYDVLERIVATDNRVRQANVAMYFVFGVYSLLLALATFVIWQIVEENVDRAIAQVVVTLLFGTIAPVFHRLWQRATQREEKSFLEYHRAIEQCNQILDKQARDDCISKRIEELAEDIREVRKNNELKVSFLKRIWNWS